MAKMLGALLRYRICWCPDCRPTRSMHKPAKKARRSTENAQARNWRNDYDPPHGPAS